MKNLYFKSPRSGSNVIISWHTVPRIPAAISHPSTSFRTSACSIILRAILTRAVSNYVCKNIVVRVIIGEKEHGNVVFQAWDECTLNNVINFAEWEPILNIHILKCFSFHFGSVHPVPDAHWVRKHRYQCVQCPSSQSPTKHPPSSSSCQGGIVRELCCQWNKRRGKCSGLFLFFKYWRAGEMA